MSAASSRHAAIRQLRQQLLSSQAGGLPRQYLSTGFPDIDAILPQHGLPTGAVVEWIPDSDGQFVATIALSFARGLMTLPGCLALIDARHEFNPGAFGATGLPWSRLLMIRPGVAGPADSDRSADSRAGAGSSGTVLRSLPTQQADTLWALEQAARCSGVRVVACWLDRVSTTALRRLQLAVERSGATIFLFRPSAALREPSWSDLRINVRRHHNGDCLLQIVSARSQTSGSSAASVRVDDETSAVSAVAQLADSAAAM